MRRTPVMVSYTLVGVAAMSLAVAALCVCVVYYDLLSLRDTYDSALGLDKWLQTVPQKQQAPE